MIVFSPKLRLVTALLLGLVLVLLNGNVFAVGGDIEQVLSALVVFVGAIGVSPIKPGQILSLIPAQLAHLLTAITTAAAFFVPNLDISGGLKSAILIVVGFVATQLVTPTIGAAQGPVDVPQMPLGMKDQTDS